MARPHLNRAGLHISSYTPNWGVESPYCLGMPIAALSFVGGCIITSVLLCAATACSSALTLVAFTDRAENLPYNKSQLKIGPILFVKVGAKVSDFLTE